MKPLLILFMISLSLLNAVELTLDEQITQLQNADTKERFGLMNALKIRISTMNARERSQAITQLKIQMHENKNAGNSAAMQGPKQMMASDQMQQMNRQNHNQGSKFGTGTPNNSGGNGTGHSKK
ncbi:MAG: hypothetical protein U9N52_13940 [Campylobacterota bacterium]|nr:hypothetical protein [Campylobacterota bacterium]